VATCSPLDLVLFSSDEWQKFTAEMIQLRKTVYTYRKGSSRLPKTNDGLPLIAASLVAPSLQLASGLAVVGCDTDTAIGKGPS